MQPLPVPTSPRDDSGRIFPARPKQAALVILGFAALLYLLELVDAFAGHALDLGGIEPREWTGLDGVLWAPLLHLGWDHLAANTVPLLVLGFLSFAGGLRQFVAVTATIWIVGGLGTWLTGESGSIHLGASGLIFGWLTFLLVRGIFARRAGPILLAVVLFFFYGYLLWGVLPGTPGVSWQGHLFGAVAGVVAGWLTGKASRRPAGSNLGA
ncbi:rhomboid family intramembrane serine protease [Crossiella sp. CA-258035]|uniref:rhomboid family intramembrane serine protease n=1 Tax=Crossiella sp. CA-258035 TaxID=2981138 RepID=UPI0024BD4D23|nr:rhomboid family intramembrane serine protease [Crossiella sp. CA-258035]WHT18351.1 rhomboid family intramembrane serine protease [Crossiella sp. CA-258035]